MLWSNFFGNVPTTRSKSRSMSVCAGGCLKKPLKYAGRALFGFRALTRSATVRLLIVILTGSTARKDRDDGTTSFAGVTCDKGGIESSVQAAVLTVSRDCQPWKLTSPETFELDRFLSLHVCAMVPASVSLDSRPARGSSLGVATRDDNILSALSTNRGGTCLGILGLRRLSLDALVIVALVPTQVLVFLRL